VPPPPPILTRCANLFIASTTGIVRVASMFSPTGNPIFRTSSAIPTVSPSTPNVWIPHEESTYSVNNDLGAVSVLNSKRSYQGPPGKK